MFGSTLTVVVFVLSANVMRADALTVHKFKQVCGTAGVSPGQFSNPRGVAINSSTANVYIADTGNNRIERLDSATCKLLGWFGGSTYEVEGKVESGPSPLSGALLTPELIAVDNSSSGPSSGDVYVVDKGHGVIDKFNAVGKYLEEQITGAKTCEKFEPGVGLPCSIEALAIDPNGSAWVSVNKGPVYRLTNQEENQQVSECKTVFGEVRELAVDGEENLYFSVGNGKFAKANGQCETLLNPISEDKEARGIAVDPKAGVVYLDNTEGKDIESFDLEGEPIESNEPDAQAPPFGGGHLARSRFLGVDSATGDVFASDSEADDVAVFEAITLPTVTAGPPIKQEPRAVVLNGTVNPEGGPLKLCVFEYDTKEYKRGEGPHGVSVPCSPSASELDSVTSDVPVSAVASPLEPQLTYHFRLVAENSAEIPSEAIGDPFFTGPLVEGSWSGDVRAESATVFTRIDPNGADTHYYVEYGLSPSYGSYTPVEPPGMDVGSAIGPQTLEAHLQGLSRATVYFYRVVAVQASESFGCDEISKVAGECDASFTTKEVPFETAGLLDGRAWELVSPPDKKGALIELFEQGGQVQTASDGSGIAYITQGASVGEDTQGKATYSQVLSGRGVGSVWRSSDLTLPGRLPEETKEPANAVSSFLFEYRLFSPDLLSALVEPQIVGTPPLPPEYPVERTPYIRDEMGGFRALVTPANISPGTKIEQGLVGKEHAEWDLRVLTATPDLKHVVLKTPAALVEPAVQEEDPTASCSESSEPRCYEAAHVQWNLYEWGEAGLSLVNILPGNEGVAHGRFSLAFPGVRLAGIVGTQIPAGRGSAQRALSGDGRRVAWTWGEPYNEQELSMYRGLYVRDMVEGRTMRVGGPAAVYQTMSSDGTKVFYLEDGELHEYVWPLGAETGIDRDLTEVHMLGEPSAGVEETISDVSEDGSYVYFVAKGVLAAGGIKEGGENNLYLLHETSGDVWSTTFIAALLDADRPSWYAETFEAPHLADVSSRVSPDGRFLAFMSSRPLTGYDNWDAANGQRDEEVFLYEAVQNRLVCASCNPTGARPNGVLDTQAAELLVDREGVWTSKETTPRTPRTDHWLAGNIPGWDNLTNQSSTYQPRYLSDNGRLFFDSPGGLVSQDTNGVEDVYEFEPDDVGGCSSSTESGTQTYVREVAGHPVDGCVGLVSSGTSGAESALMDASEEGNDVFFVTASKLVGEDYDKGYDVYDAHVCTSSVPCVTRAEQRPQCTSEESCRPAQYAPPAIFAAPPSATFEGIGNLTPPPPTKVKPKSLTNAQKLARALKTCHRDKNKKRRATCERKARRKYPVKTSTRAKRSKRGSNSLGSQKH